MSQKPLRSCFGSSTGTKPLLGKPPEFPLLQNFKILFESKRPKSGLFEADDCGYASKRRGRWKDGANSAPPELCGAFYPEDFTVLKEGYGLAAFRADCVSSLTVAIVALPLSMAIAISSGASPERGLYTSVFGGFLVSALGGSRFQIGGPAGALIILVLDAATQYGAEGLILATFLSGLILLGLGFARLGTFISGSPPFFHPASPARA